MNNPLNPDGKRLHRPVPEDTDIDPVGLVDSWHAAAEDWLLAFQAADALSAQEAFEGIEHWGRLMRCQDALIDQVQGRQTRDRLSNILLDPDHRTAFLTAVRFPDLVAWREQARRAWEAEEEDLSLARQLLEDLDAADFVAWYLELTQPPAAPSPPEFTAFEQQLDQCHLWLDAHAMLFVIGEPYIRAAALTIPEEPTADDPTGRLLLSTVKYMRLLDECETARQWMQPPTDLEFLANQPALGAMKLDYQVPQLAHAAGAQAPFVAPSKPLCWFDPLRQYQALLFLPPFVTPGQDTTVELLFATGPNFSQPAESLVGAQVRLGGAQALIEAAARADDERMVFCLLSLAKITATVDTTISLWIDDQPWAQ